MNDKKGMTYAEMIALLIGDPELIEESSPEGIMRAERDGQETTVAMEILPRQLSGYGGDSRDQLTALGIEVVNEYDNLFYRVKLPTGWKKVAEDHSMWSRLEDEQGKKVASIFYKAAFYDRDAFISVVSK